MKLIAVGDCQTGHKDGYETKGYFWHDMIQDMLPDITILSRGSEMTGWHGWWNYWESYIVKEKPNVVVIFGGVYHFSYDDDPNEELRKMATNMSESAKKNGIILVFCSIQPFKDASFWTEKRQEHLDVFNKWLSEFCTTRGDVFIDAFKFLEEEPGSKKQKKEWTVETSFQINDNGQKALGEYITKRLKESFPEIQGGEK